MSWIMSLFYTDRYNDCCYIGNKRSPLASSAAATSCPGSNEPIYDVVFRLPMWTGFKRIISTRTIRNSGALRDCLEGCSLCIPASVALRKRLQHGAPLSRKLRRRTGDSTAPIGRASGLITYGTLEWVSVNDAPERQAEGFMPQVHWKNHAWIRQFSSGLSDMHCRT